VGGVVDELEWYRGRIEVQPRAVLVVVEISESGDGDHRHIAVSARVAAAAGTGVEQQVGASAGAGVAGLGNETQDDIGAVGILHRGMVTRNQGQPPTPQHSPIPAALPKALALIASQDVRTN
jgi:hypothetical protein